MSSGVAGRHRLHIAAEGFARSARVYDRGRPEYPKEALRCLAVRLPFGPQKTVVELGSGTGKFTRAVLSTGATVVPVEPTEAMRRVFAMNFPHVPVLSGTAEAIPVPNAFADAVVVAQAFHWFRAKEALREIARVLRPGGGLGLVWNVRDESVPWVHRLTEIIDPYDPGGPRFRRRKWRKAFEGSRMFTRLSTRRFRHVQNANVATVVDRTVSISFIAILPAAERRKVVRAVRGLLRTEPMLRGHRQIAFPYETEVYWCHRR